MGDGVVVTCKKIKALVSFFDTYNILKHNKIRFHISKSQVRFLIPQLFILHTNNIRVKNSVVFLSNLSGHFSVSSKFRNRKGLFTKGSEDSENAFFSFHFILLFKFYKESVVKHTP